MVAAVVELQRFNYGGGNLNSLTPIATEDLQPLTQE